MIAPSPGPASAPAPRVRRLAGTFVDPALEAEFARDSSRTIQVFRRFTVTLSAVIFLGYGVHDYVVMPPALVHEAWGLRYALALPMLALVLPLVWTGAWPRLHDPAMLLFGLTLNAVVLALGARVGGEVGALQTSYAPLIVVLGPFIVRMNVAYEIAFALLTVALYDGIAFAIGHPSVVESFSINMALASMGFMGALVARQMEGQAREGFVQRRIIREQLAALDAEKRRSDALLLNVLPAAIAERLKAENRPIADGFQDVSVLFADIVGFTALSERLTPQDLVERLNELFSAFDDLLDRLRLEKIKTIGDAYMVVGGLNGGKDHALALAELALDMLVRIRELAVRHGEDFSVRIGIHTGPVVGGVIGKKKFIYDVWGDTVNVASRMESSGVPGAVQISHATYTRIRTMYVFEDRGEIAVKGKAPMRAWLIVDRRKDVHVDRSSLIA
jgi:class 3 adenylate cyclase